jgi:hypothetical protein
MGGITASALTLRQPHRCGALTPSQQARSQALSPTALVRYGSPQKATAKQALGRISKSTLKGSWPSAYRRSKIFLK